MNLYVITVHTAKEHGTLDFTKLGPDPDKVCFFSEVSYFVKCVSNLTLHPKLLSKEKKTHILFSYEHERVCILLLACYEMWKWFDSWRVPGSQDSQDQDLLQQSQMNVERGLCSSAEKLFPHRCTAMKYQRYFLTSHC